MTNKPPLQFKVAGQCNRARAGELTLPHGVINTPIFMPVGTQGTVKGITPEQLHELHVPIILGNTYHLGHRPGTDIIEKAGGLHKFMGWDGNILTDSGGFQMVSLFKLMHVSEEGVHFTSPHTEEEMLLTPEHSIHLQNQIGSDIMMALDDVVSSTTTGPRVEEAMHRTTRWIDRCNRGHARPTEQNLFGIVQGGLDPALRDRCLDEMISKDLPGYAIGGLSGGESKDAFWKIVEQCAPRLPSNKPRYLMGVGYGIDMIICIGLGVDMFDCVYPTRTGRFGTALIDGEVLHIKNAAYAEDMSPLDPDCDCKVCKTYTRAMLHNIFRDEVGMRLITYHNIAYQLRLMTRARNAILENRYPAFVREFVSKCYPNPQDIPEWVRMACDVIETPPPASS